MKILITGSSGFIGSELKKFLKTKRIDVVEFDIKNKDQEDVRDFDRVLSFAKGVDGIVHLAAVSRVKWGFENPQRCVDINIIGTQNILEAARISKKVRSNGNPWVIFGSSREVFGEAQIFPVTESSQKAPVNVYGVTKVTGEELCKSYSKNYGLRTRVLRFSNVYSGPKDQLDRVIPNFIIKTAKNKPLIINGSGGETFDFTYINDTIAGTWQCINDVANIKRTQYDDFNLLTGKETSLKELAEFIIGEMDSSSTVIYRAPRLYDVNKFYGSPKKASDILGFRPRTSLQQGMPFVIQRFRDEGIISA